MLQSDRRRKPEKFHDRRFVAEETQGDFPLFVSLSRQSQGLLRNTKRGFLFVCESSASGDTKIRLARSWIRVTSQGKTEGNKSMFCEKCGSKIDDGQHFCAKCGASANNEPCADGKNSAQAKKSGKGLKITLVAVALTVVLIGGVGAWLWMEFNQSKKNCLLAMQGRNVFIGLTQANIEQEGAGSAALWPTIQIPQLNFKTSTEYFKALLGSSYASCFRRECMFDEKTGKAKWIVAKGVTEETSDNVPVFISANVDVRSLLTIPGELGPEMITGEAQLMFSGSSAIIVTKGGYATVYKKGKAKLADIYRGGVIIPNGFSYIEP